MEINFVISGEAGQGIETASEIASRLLHKAGFNVFTYNEYMSRIRGGCNSLLIKVGGAPCFSERIDFLLVLDEKAFEHLKDRISDKTVVVDAQKSNVFAIGYISAFFGLENVLESLKSDFPKILGDDKNLQAFEAGFSFSPRWEKVPDRADEGELFSGSDALATGSIAGGANFIAYYPMSPSTNFSAFLTKHADEFNIVSVQVEDEICAINMAIGASYAGARSCVSTAGGGFSLMCEGVSLAGMLEMPVVIHIGGRPGPATGLPTRTAQEDLNLALYSGHGEFERIIFAPSNLEDAFIIGQRAFELTQKYQVPVFILTDQYFLESSYGVNRPLTPALSHAGKRGLPGFSESVIYVDSDEHDEKGFITEDFGVRRHNVERRLGKLELIKQDVLKPYFIGDSNAENLIISWGSNFNVIKAAIENRKNFALLHFNQVYPLPDISGYIESKKLIIIENNAKGQFARLLGLKFEHSFLKYDGMPFSIEEVGRFLDEI